MPYVSRYSIFYLKKLPFPRSLSVPTSQKVTCLAFHIHKEMPHLCSNMTMQLQMADTLFLTSTEKTFVTLHSAPLLQILMCERALLLTIYVKQPTLLQFANSQKKL